MYGKDFRPMIFQRKMNSCLPAVRSKEPRIGMQPCASGFEKIGPLGGSCAREAGMI